VRHDFIRGNTWPRGLGHFLNHEYLDEGIDHAFFRWLVFFSLGRILIGILYSLPEDCFHIFLFVFVFRLRFDVIKR
jgi:hypothetical protein